MIVANHGISKKGRGPPFGYLVKEGAEAIVKASCSLFGSLEVNP